MQVKDYQSAERMLATARNPEQGKPVANNTRLFRRGDKALAVQLHRTDVVTYHQDGSFTLDSGGWQTVTTKARMGEFAPASPYSVKGVWYVDWPRGSYNHEQHKQEGNTTYLFVDGLRFFPGGKVLTAAGEKAKPHDAKAEAKKRKLRLQAANYAKGFIDRLYSGKVAAPGAGDCFYCQMTVAEGPDKGRGLGEVVRDREHILAHLQERYYVPSLLYRALEAFGASQVERATVWNLTHGEEPQWPGAEDRQGFFAKHIEKYVKRYVLRQLGEAA